MDTQKRHKNENRQNKKQLNEIMKKQKTFISSQMKKSMTRLEKQSSVIQKQMSRVGMGMSDEDSMENSPFPSSRKVRMIHSMDMDSNL